AAGRPPIPVWGGGKRPPPLGEEKERGRGHGFEVGHGDGRPRPGGGEDARKRPVELARLHVLLFEADPLGDLVQVGRRVEPGAHAVGSGDRREGRRRGSLSVGPAAQDRGERALRASEPGADRVDRGETEADTALPEGLEPGETREVSPSHPTGSGGTSRACPSSPGAGRRSRASRARGGTRIAG